MQVCAVQVSREFIRKGRGTNVLTAVAPCDLTIGSGTLVVLRGRSGSGKSTLLTMLAGLLAPTGGVVRYDETDIYRMSDAALSAFRNRHIGFIPQGQSAVASLTVRDNILLPYMLYGEADATAYARAEELMEHFGIAGLAEAMPGELSGGELRRMAIARALLREPEVLLADEPTGDLDDENTATVFALLRDAAESGVAVLVVTHEQEAKRYADVRYRMDAGVLYEE